MRKALWIIGAAVVAVMTMASYRVAPVPRIERDQRQVITLGPQFTAYDYYIYNLGVLSPHTSSGITHAFYIKTATVDTMRCGTAKKTRAVYSSATDSLMVGTGLAGRSTSVTLLAGTDSNIDAGFVRVAGRDYRGTKVVEIWTVTENTDLSAQGIYCMAHIDSVTTPAATSASDVVLQVGRGHIIQVPFTGAYPPVPLSVWQNATWGTVGATPGLVDSDSCYASATVLAQNGIHVAQTAQKGSYDWRIIIPMSRYQSATAATLW